MLAKNAGAIVKNVEDVALSLTLLAHTFSPRAYNVQGKK
jgi:hypothetical protein